jgi:hypothetical protein
MPVESGHSRNLRIEIMFEKACGFGPCVVFQTGGLAFRQ